MVFSSQFFLFYFLPLALLLYAIAPRCARNAILTVLSYLFYGWANPAFAILMFASTIIDFICGLIITGQSIHHWKQPVTILPLGQPRSRRQRTALIISIATNLALLGFFKYFNFATDSFDAAVAALGLPGLSLDLAFRITLPLGISFYTFQSMSYSIDVYRGHAKGIRNFIDFACYVSMFPQLVAGPIIRFQEIANQLTNRSHNIEKFARGVSFICLGLAKKVLLANSCGKVADMVFNASGTTILDAWFGATSYAFQIYFDFSGYSDMAIGLGLILGFTFPKNFNSPYCADSITDFWRRWHISLSTWLRDYLYLPLGGNRKSPSRTYLNLMLVMLLGGLWHGASWNFVVWGAIHGGLLAIERLNHKDSYYRQLPRWTRVTITFTLVTVSWIFFRAENLPAAFNMCKSLVGLSTAHTSSQLISGLIYQPYYIIFTAISAAIVWLAPQSWDFTQKLTAPKALAIITLFILSTLALATQSFNPFIYFIF